MRQIQRFQGLKDTAFHRKPIS